MAVDFQFKSYVDRRKTAGPERDDAGPDYAYSGDVKAMSMLKKLRPVTVAAEATIRMSKELLRNDLVGSSVMVTANQFRKLYAVVLRCAETLQIPVPTVYVRQNPSLNASTYGTTDDSFIVLHSALVDHFTDEELAFVIGHECGHIHNGHVLFLTAAHYLRSIASQGLRTLSLPKLALQAVTAPALYALNAWSRRAEITCDRAGLLVVKDLALAQRSIIKLSVGSQRLYEQINIEEYLKQVEEVKTGLGRLSELEKTHPYQPKRVAALQLFSDAEVFQKALGKPGGKGREEIDEKVSELLSVT